MIRRRHLGLAAGSLLAAPALRAQESWPNRPVTVLVPWAAGGGADSATRAFATGLEREIGQPVNVVNRTGGSGIVGHTAISNAAPDGYTLGIATSEITTFKAMGLSELTPDSLTLISRIATLPASVVVRGNSPWRTIADLRGAMTEARRGQFTASGSGVGGSWHLAVAGMLRAIGMEVDRVRWVPSQGGAPAVQDVAAGGLTMFTGSPGEAKGLLDGGQVRALAVMSPERMAVFPEVPTLRESGVDWTFQNWFALVGPRNLSPVLATRISEVAGRGQARPEVEQLMAQRGIVRAWESRDAFAAYAREYVGTATTLLRELGMVQG